MLKIYSVVLFLMLATASTVLMAGNKGYGSAVSNNEGLPNGKPFQTIQTVLDDLQDQINILVGRTDLIEERVTALEEGVESS